MASNRKGGSKQSGTPGSKSGSQGGTHEQHVEAGRQSHKNDGNKQSGAGGSSSGSPSGSKSGGSKNR